LNKYYYPKGLFTLNHKKVQNVRHYSSSSDIKIVPIFTLEKLTKDHITLHKDKLKSKAGIYSLINTIDGKQYIGSAKDLYLRLNEHIKGKKSNVRLQRAIEKHGIDNFQYCVYEYFTFDNFVINDYTLVDLETSYIGKFDLKELYNFKSIANSSIGYKHTEEAILKMIERFKDKNNHPMFGKTHTKQALKAISKPGELNPMFGKTHSEKTKSIISDRMSKYPLGVGIYDLHDNLINKFKNNSELAKHLGISRVTVGKYLNGKLVYQEKFIFKPIS